MFWGSIDYLIPNETELAFLSGEPVNTIEQVKTATAAGDTFVAAFAVKIAEGEEIREAIAFACHAGALTTTKVGALPSIPFRKEVEDFRRGSF